MSDRALPIPTSYPRRIVQIAACAAENGFSLIALADDGSLWATDTTSPIFHRWTLVPALPPFIVDPPTTTEATP